MNGEHPAMAILDLFAKQIIHRPLNHTEFDATYATLRAELADAEPQAYPTTEQEELDDSNISVGGLAVETGQYVAPAEPIVPTHPEPLPIAEVNLTGSTVNDIHKTV